MKNFKKQHRAFSIIFCVFFLFVFNCSSEAGKKSEIERKVDALLKAKDYTSALEILNESIKQNPEKPHLRALKVRVLAEMGDIIKATEEYLKFYNFTEKHSPKILHEIAFGYNKSKHRQSPYWGKFYFALMLTHVGDNSGIGILKEALKNENKKVRLTSATALAKLGDNSGISILMEALKSEDKRNRPEIAESLARLGDKSGITFLKKALEDERIRWRAARAMQRLGDNSGIAFLRKKGMTEPARPAGPVDVTELRCAEALGRLGDEKGIALLREALKDEDKMMAAMDALVRLGDKSIIPILTDKLNETINEIIPMENSKGKYEKIEELFLLLLFLYKITK